jgi:hypothetical protein
MSWLTGNVQTRKIWGTREDNNTPLKVVLGDDAHEESSVRLRLTNNIANHHRGISGPRSCPPYFWKLSEIFMSLNPRQKISSLTAASWFSSSRFSCFRMAVKMKWTMESSGWCVVCGQGLVTGSWECGFGLRRKNEFIWNRIKKDEGQRGEKNVTLNYKG